jgi:hypothetical protein
MKGAGLALLTCSLPHVLITRPSAGPAHKRGHSIRTRKDGTEGADTTTGQVERTRVPPPYMLQRLQQQEESLLFTPLLTGRHCGTMPPTNHLYRETKPTLPQGDHRWGRETLLAM